MEAIEHTFTVVGRTLHVHEYLVKYEKHWLLGWREMERTQLRTIGINGQYEIDHTTGIQRGEFL